MDGEISNLILTPGFKANLQLLKPVSYLVLSDIHLGAKSNTASEIIQNLCSFFDNFENSKFQNLDVIFIAGDLFDQALWFNDENFLSIFSFFRKLMDWCQHFSIKLRVLEGTPSHDRKQPKNLLPIAAAFPKLDFRYIETMCVEAFYDLGITCLYIPDEYAGSAEAAQKLIQEELDRLGIDKVSIAIMHGMFTYQVPEISSTRYKYDEQFFLDRVQYFINIGHVHKFSTYDRILSQGSFDRLAHGEEESKGGIMVTLTFEQKFFQFLENKGAKIYKTCHVRNKDIDKAVEQIERLAVSLPNGSYVRIKASKSHPVLNLLDQFNKKYVDLTFTKITEEEESERKQLIDTKALLSVDYTPININKDNIVSMVMAQVSERYNFQHDLLIKLETKLLELT